MTVRQIVDEIIKKTGVGPLPEDETCDLLMAGDWNAEVTKVATTFMATIEVIQQAAREGAQLIITHEPTWFTGADDTGWLLGDPVYEEKRRLLEQTGVSIWRFHDHMHFGKEDGIFRGFEKETGWEKYRIAPPRNQEKAFGVCYQLPPTTLGMLCQFFKEKMEMDTIQIIGDAEMTVRRVGVLPGGGSLGLGTENMPMRLMRKMQLDIVVCGDILGWTLPAYVWDAYQLGQNKGLLVLGHERSEEVGMKYLGEWMQPFMRGIPVVFIDSREPFIYL